MADLSNAACVQTSWDATTSERVYTVLGPYVPGGCYDQVLIPAAAFQPILDASGSTSSSTSAFTSDEIAALKYQAANPSPFNLSLEEASVILAAVLGVLGIGYCWRSIARFVSAGDSSGD